MLLLVSAVMPITPHHKQEALHHTFSCHTLGTRHTTQFSDHRVNLEEHQGCSASQHGTPRTRGPLAAAVYRLVVVEQPWWSPRAAHLALTLLHNTV